MQTFVLTLHIVVCVFLVVIVLLQSGKEGMGVIFGGGSGSLFGSSGAGGILAKATAVAAGIFVVTSLSYNYMSAGKSTRESSIMDAPAPVAPAKPQGIVVDDKPQTQSDSPAPGTLPAGNPAAAPATSASPQASAGQPVPEKGSQSPAAPAATAAPAQKSPAPGASEPGSPKKPGQ